MSNDAPAATAPAAMPTPVAIIKPPKEIRYDPQNPATLYMDAGAFEQIQRVGRMLANSNLVPDHLRSRWGMVDGKSTCIEDRSGDCALIFCQALRWELDPLAVAQNTFVVKGKLGYEGKLIAALINMSGRTEEPLRYTYSGPVDGNLAIVVSARFKGESEDRTTPGDFASWHTTKDGKVSDQWRPGQRRSMLRYRGAREWAREHMPEILLGIQSAEDLHGDTSEADAVETVRLGDTHVPVNRVVETLRAQAAAAKPEPHEHPAPAKLAAGSTYVCEVLGCGEEVVGTCTHPGVKPSALALTPSSKLIACPDCPAELRGMLPREPGDEDEPAPPAADVAAVKAVAAAAQAQPDRKAQGRRPSLLDDAK